MADMINLRELELELVRSSRTVEDWSAAAVSEAQDAKGRHVRGLNDQDSKIQSLTARFHQARTLGREVQARVVEERSKEAAAESAFGELAAEGAALQQQLALLQGLLSAEEQRVNHARDDLKVESSVQQKRLDALRRAVRLFSDRLGLEFRHGAEELQLVFSQVDAQQPDRPFVLSVRIQADNTYEVTQCNPSIESLPLLVERLNSSNDFSAFVKAVRKAFVQCAGE